MALAEVSKTVPVKKTGVENLLTRFKSLVFQKTQQTELDLKEHVEKVKHENILLADAETKVPDLLDLHVPPDEENAIVLKQQSGSSHITDIIQDVCSSTVGLIREANPTVMFEYMKKAFSSIPQATIDLLSKEPKVKESRDLILKCNVIKASNLPSKDFSSTSEIYWIATIMNKEFIDSIDSIKELSEKRLIGQTWQSSFKTKTLNPVWNEPFEICITDPENQCLVIELWCSQKEQKKSSKQIEKDDNFLGRALYILQDIPASGEEKMLKLIDKSTHSKGTVLIFLKITEKQVDRKPEEGYLSHKQLFEDIVSWESKSESGHLSHWDCKLSEDFYKTLAQHASLHHISQLQQAAIQLTVLLNYHRAHRVKIGVFCSLLQTIHFYEYKIQQHSRDESWINQLLKDLKDLRNYILNIMNCHINFFNNFGSIKSISLFKDHVLVLRDLCQIKLLRPQLAPEQLDLRVVLTNAIQTAVPHWMILLSAKMKPDHNSSENTLLTLKAFCSHCLTLCQRSLTRVHPVLIEIGVDYFSPFFASMDKILYGETSSRLESYSGSSILSYEIYRIIQEIETYSYEVNPEFLKEQRRTLFITSFHAWFEKYVFDWVKVAQLKVRERLDRALELDAIVETSDKAPFSSSAVDTHAFFLQAITFWKDLKWPVRGQSLGYFIAILQCICEMAAYYTDKVVAKIKTGLSLYNDGDFVVTDKLCVALNNIHHISEVLKNIPNEISLERYYRWLDEEKREDGHPLSEKAEITTTDVLKSANEDILNKIEHAINVVQAKLLPSVIKFIPKILSAPPNSDLDQVVEPLLEYITVNVGKLGKSLLTPIFHKILHHLWIHIVMALKKSYDKIPHSAESFQHIGLNYVLLHLSYFFEADGKGLDRKFIENDSYKTLSDDLFYATQSTEDNIRIFCNDLVKQQASSQNKFGILHVSHIYKPTDKVLSAEIVSGENLQGLEQRRSNVFVRVFLLPTFSEANEKIYKTETKKQTLDPIFNETIKMHISSEQLFKESAILLIAVLGQDTFRSNVLIGLCAIPCTSIPIEGTEPKMEHLHLFHYERTKAYKELELRHADTIAQDFLRRINNMSEYKKGANFMQVFQKLVNVHKTDKK
ncbi:PREDICTED: protein unc-13 homolog D-like [Amphimedon queenslandica]|uniref:C2 domain-containing protein n=1 Tax=Amphimedon queenslandica TaxID=400682 RepID=A0A1X7VVR0_AMPQE|nr:PREDICTED: protein unc-13 homolog D-like [Amphimedon queenslandica]|eukprot:XP_019853528.1 PREDICTED: protein unc-13 homolog D-like [Amphimedon queenslandica]